MTLYSILDQAPIRAGVSPAQSIREAHQLAQLAEALGYHRYWIAEHHAFASVASTAPEVLIGHVAGRTERIRVGSGAVLLPNHRPLHVAEQFRTLEALYPGRIDLGIGRSEGARQDATVRSFARPENSQHATGYERQLDELLAFGGVQRLPADDPFAGVLAGPADAPLPPVFVLGSSPDSATLAASRGLGYGFAAYTNPDRLVEAMLRYRREFVPTEPDRKPHAILGVRVFVGESDEHAHALAAPSHLAHVQARAGTGAPLISVDDALAHHYTAAEHEVERQVKTRVDVIGDPETAARQLAELITETHADEVIVTTNTFDPADRFASYERLATAVCLSKLVH